LRPYKKDKNLKATWEKYFKEKFGKKQKYDI
jgi:hypothetical protein